MNVDSEAETDIIYRERVDEYVLNATTVRIRHLPDGRYSTNYNSTHHVFVNTVEVIAFLSNIISRELR